jgi:hypothetical protein
MSSRAVVDLPQPDSPTMPRVSPSMTSKSMPSTARTTFFGPKKPPAMGKCLTRPRTVRRGRLIP